jgi:hypothetical protein
MTNALIPAGTMKSSGWYGTATVLPRGEIYVQGASTAGTIRRSGMPTAPSAALGRKHAFGRLLEQWGPVLKDVEPMSQDRQWSTSTVMPDGKVLVSGGSSGSLLGNATSNPGVVA